MKKNLLSFLCLLYACNLYAQDTDTSSAKKTWLSGYGDVYYKYNFNENVTDNKTSFTGSHNSFELGMLSLQVQHAFGKVSFTGDLGFGKRAEAFSYNDRKSSVALKQLFISYKPVSWLKLTAGSFATYIGYELVDASQNRNYSMSYLFSYGPFFHTGIKMAATVGSSTFMAGVFNPADYKYAPLGSKKYIGGQWAFSPQNGPFASYLNYIGGQDTAGVRNDQLDLVLTYRFTPRFSLAYEGSYSRYSGSSPEGAWWGSVVYVNVDCSETLGFTLRAEYFNDEDHLKVFTDATQFPDGGAVWSYTLSTNYKIGALTLIPELRLDHATVPVFNKGLNSRRNSANVLIAAVYCF